MKKTKPINIYSSIQINRIFLINLKDFYTKLYLEFLRYIKIKSFLNEAKFFFYTAKFCQLRVTWEILNPIDTVFALCKLILALFYSAMSLRSKIHHPIISFKNR